MAASAASAASAADAPLSKVDQLARWTEILKIPGNECCAECASADRSWVVLDYGVLLCIHCAGAHRALGSHISKVRSVDMDVFTDAEFTWLASLGNRKSNTIWEAALPPSMRRPAADSPACVRRRWLVEKYDEQRFLLGTEALGDADRAPHERTRGWLSKQGSFVPTWRRRFFAVDEARSALRYYTDESAADSTLRGTLPLAGAVVELDDAEPLQFRVKFADGTPELVARAASSADLEGWIWALHHLTHAAARAAAADPEAAAAAAAARGSRRGSNLIDRLRGSRRVSAPG